MHRLDYRAGNISYFTNVSLIFHKYYSYVSTDHKSKANIKAKINTVSQKKGSSSGDQF